MIGYPVLLYHMQLSDSVLNAFSDHVEDHLLNAFILRLASPRFRRKGFQCRAVHTLE